MRRARLTIRTAVAGAAGVAVLLTSACGPQTGRAVDTAASTRDDPGRPDLDQIRDSFGTPPTTVGPIPAPTPTGHLRPPRRGPGHHEGDGATTTRTATPTTTRTTTTTAPTTTTTTAPPTTTTTATTTTAPTTTTTSSSSSTSTTSTTSATATATATATSDPDDSSAVLPEAGTSTTTPSTTGRYIHVAPDGSDARTGTSRADAVKTLQRAANLTTAGDTVLVYTGTYSVANGGNPLIITRSGSAGKPITFAAAKDNHPLIKTQRGYGIIVGASYITLQGFTIQGNRADVTLDEATAAAAEGKPFNYHGIALTDGSSHLLVRANVVKDTTGGGIGGKLTDYVTIEDNVVARTSWYSDLGPSGISLLGSRNTDSSTGIKNIIRRNVSYGNQNLLPTKSSGKITDGNGIIIDTLNNAKLGVSAYQGRTLVENNVVYGNGGEGINIFNSPHVDIVNNTSFHNSNHTQYAIGELALYGASDVRVRNNILVATSTTGASVSAGSTEAKSGTVTLDHNLVVGTTTAITDADAVTGDPAFTDSGKGDFRPGSGSAAIDAGTSDLAPDDDLVGTDRPRGGGIDLGAYEVG